MTLPPVKTVLSLATPRIFQITSQNPIHPAGRKSHPWETWIFTSQMLLCSMQASWRTQLFPNIDLNFEVTVSTLTTPEQLVLLEFQPEGGIATLPVPSNPWDFLIFIIKQLAFVPLLYQWSLQQNCEAIPIAWQNLKPISNPMPTMNPDMSHQIWTWISAQDQTWWKPDLALHHLYSALKPNLVSTTQVSSQLMSSISLWSWHFFQMFLNIF